MANTIAQKKAKKKAKRKIITAKKNKKLNLLKKERDLKLSISLIDQGYLKISNKHCIVSRLDREDWKCHMAISQYPWSITEGLDWVNGLEDAAEDYYRRCHSNDKIIVSKDVLKLIESSDWKTMGFKSLI